MKCPFCGNRLFYCGMGDSYRCGACGNFTSRQKIAKVSDMADTMVFVSVDMDVEHIKIDVAGSVRKFNSMYRDYDTFFEGSDGELWGMFGIVPGLDEHVFHVRNSR